MHKTLNINQKETEMKYKGIEIKEFTSEMPLLFDPPKRMLAWNCNDETPYEVEVIAFIPSRYHKVIEQTSLSLHCAEIPEVLNRRATNLELAKWLVQGNGQYKVSGGEWIWTEHHYTTGQDYDACSKFILVRKWGEKEWHEPTREYLGLENK